MRTAIITLGVFLGTLGSMSAQRSAEPPDYRHMLGISASNISGAGLSYRYSFNEDFSSKITGIIFYNERETNGQATASNYLTYNGGLEVQGVFYRTDNTRFYGLLGASYFYSRNEFPSGDIIAVNLFKQLNFGAGFGIEFSLWRRILLNVDGGMKFGNTREMNTNLNLPGVVDNITERGIGIAGGIGIGYTF